MKHSKATLKFSINIRKAIALVIDNTELLDKIEYTVDWSNFPNSLKMQCQLSQKRLSPVKFTDDIETKTIKNIQLSFLKQGIKFRNVRKNIEFKWENASPDSAK